AARAGANANTNHFDMPPPSVSREPVGPPEDSSACRFVSGESLASPEPGNKFPQVAGRTVGAVGLNSRRAVCKMGRREAQPAEKQAGRTAVAGARPCTEP